MENLEWKPVYYNGLETNVEVTKCGKVKKVQKEWYGFSKYCSNIIYGEIDLTKLKLNKNGYRQIGIQIKEFKPRQVHIQQLVASAFLDYKWNGHDFVVMHLDDNPLNNNLSNLQIGTNRKNCSQERTIKTGLPVGVCWHKKAKKYLAQIHINGKNNYLGLFNTIEEASQAYQNKLKEISIHKNN
jgi:hypothetical protein